MDTFMKFLFAILKQFFGGLWRVISNIFLGIFDIVNLNEYFSLFDFYGDGLGVGGWILAILTFILLIAIFAGIITLIVFGIKRLVRLFREKEGREVLLAEVGNLNKKVTKLSKEKEKLLKNGYGRGLGDIILDDDDSEGSKDTGALADGESRFYKLTQIDEKYEKLALEAAIAESTESDNVQTEESENEFAEPVVNGVNITLEELCDRFRNFACSELHLFYDIRIIRLFVAAMSSTRLIILQGISGTGKTSLPYAWGKFLNNDAQVASVQPSWRDRSELYGYFNEFTKRYNETEILRSLYEASYNDKVYAVILDEMNIAKVEYYFAEMLSILEMPSRDEWVVDLVPAAWPNDPKHIVEGRFKLPANLWYVGTANNDDSTFAISDKVYDRAIPINIDTKGKPFDAPKTEKIELSFAHFDELFNEAISTYVVSDETLQKLDELDEYVILHMRLAFGNRIVKQLKEFIPAYIACGGTELDGLDYVLANKIFRKFSSMNMNFIRDEIDGLIEELKLLFGEDSMEESVAFLKRLKRS